MGRPSHEKCFPYSYLLESINHFLDNFFKDLSLLIFSINFLFLILNESVIKYLELWAFLNFLITIFLKFYKYIIM